MEIIGKDEALSRSLKFYFTGISCKHGHVSNRYVSNNICVDCQSTSNSKHWVANRTELMQQHQDRLQLHGDKYNQNRKEKYKTDNDYREKVKKRVKDWAILNRHIVFSDKNKQIRRNYQKQHIIKCRLISKEWRQNNREHVNEQGREYQSNHRSYYNARCALYRANKMRATPKWCEQEEIRLLYQACKELSIATGVTYNVDHIIPLTHSLVCGLHCISNLQIITESENKVKHNKFVLD
jgi:hypothetical protein